MEAQPADHVADEEELCRVLQTHIRTLEQKELAQMRQGAILQRKVDVAEQQLKESRQRQASRRGDAERLQRAQVRARNSDFAQKCEEALRTLEADLQRRWEASCRREEECQTKVRSEQAKQVQLENDLNFWRRCGQELLRREEEEAPSTTAEEQTAAAAVAALEAEADSLNAEAEALRRSAEDLGAQLPEVERMAQAARAQEAELMAGSSVLQADLTRATEAAQRAHERAQAAREEELELLRQVDLLEGRAVAEEQQEAISASSAAIVRSNEEVETLQRRLHEREQEVSALETERARLTGLLQRHTGGHNQQGRASAMAQLGLATTGEVGGCGPVDETVSWVVMVLFKSILVRRAFCVHLAVLYSWLLFLLWYLSSREQH